MSEENKAIVTRWFDEYWGKGNDAIVDELGADDILFSYPLTGELSGKEPVKACIRALYEAFPDIVFEVTDPLIAEGDKVVGRWRGEGTQEGEFAGIPAEGKRISFTGTTIYRVENGKVAEEIGEEDAWLVLRQLGAIPE